MTVHMGPTVARLTKEQVEVAVFEAYYSRGYYHAVEMVGAIAPLCTHDVLVGVMVLLNNVALEDIHLYMN